MTHQDDREPRRQSEVPNHPLTSVSLMGTPHVNHPISTSPEAMQMLALLILTGMARSLAQPQFEIERDWLAAQAAPALFSENPRAARDKAHYLIERLHQALNIRTNKQEGKRERKVYEVSLTHLTIDIFEIQRAAQGGRHKDVLALAKAPLLDSMEYPWLDDPVFLQLGASVDVWCLRAFLTLISVRIAEFENAAQIGHARAQASRQEACLLLDKATDWLAKRSTVLRRREPGILANFAQKLTECRVRAAHPLPSTGAETQDPHLPDPPTDLVGREREIGEIRERLGGSRLLTLTGPGGLGKTRLAIAVARSSRPDFSEDAVFADLSAVTEAGQLPQTLAWSLGLVGDGKQSWSTLLQSFLAEKRLLLVWDNCEQIVAACRTQAEALLPACPHIKILVTSREPLAPLHGALPETIYPVPALSLPEDRAEKSEEEAETLPEALLPELLMCYEATRLFAARAVAVCPQFALTPQNSPTVLQICRSLDGLPLAIELAAALVPDQSVQQIAQSLHQRFAMLTQGGRMGTLRHSSLQAAFDLSYARLTPQQQQAFRALGVFVGSFPLEAAQSVTSGKDGSLPEFSALLGQFARKSLIVIEDRHGERRYRLLETVRQYAQDRLQEHGEWEETRRRHRLYYLKLAEEAEVHLKGPEPTPWLDRLDTEIANLRAALEWRTDELAVRLAYALSRFWHGRGHLQEGSRWLERVLQAEDDFSPLLQVKAWNSAGSLAFALGEFQDAQHRHERGLALARQADDQAGIAESLNGLGVVTAHQGDYDRAQTLIEGGLSLRRQVGDAEGIALSLNYRAMMANFRGDNTAARTLLEESLALMRQLQDTRNIANGLHNLGIVAFHRLEVLEANAYFEESLTLWRRLGDKYGIAKSLNGLGEVAMYQGDFETAATANTESLRLRRYFGDKYGIANSLNGLGEAALLGKADEAAQTYFEESLALRQQIGEIQSIPHSLHNLGEVALFRCDYVRARAYFFQCLPLMRENEDLHGLADSLESLASTFVLPEDAARSACLLGAADTLRLALGSPRLPRTQAAYDAHLAALRTHLGEDAYTAAWKQGHEMTWEEAVAFALGEAQT